MTLAKRSPAYRSLRAEVSDPVPVDSWLDDAVAYIVFGLRPAAGSSGPATLGQVIFALEAASGTLLAVRRVEARRDTDEPLVEDLLAPGAQSR